MPKQRGVGECWMRVVGEERGFRRVAAYSRNTSNGGRCILRHYKENNAIPATSNNSSITISFRARSARGRSHSRRQTSSAPLFGKQRSNGEGAKVCWAGGELHWDLCYANPCIPTVGLDWSRCAFLFFAQALLTSEQPKGLWSRQRQQQMKNIQIKQGHHRVSRCGTLDEVLLALPRLSLPEEKKNAVFNPSFISRRRHLHSFVAFQDAPF